VSSAQQMPTGMRRDSVDDMPNRRPPTLDIALAAVAAAGLIVEGQLRSSGGLSLGAYALAIAAAAPLAWRNTAPLASLVAVEAGALLCAFAFHASWAATAMVVVALYTVALHGNRSRSLIVGAITAVVAVVAVALIDGGVELTGSLLRVLLVVVSLVLGDTIRSRRALRTAGRERAEREARERQRDADRRLASERLRIARDLHDALAHSLVAINVRASVALDLHDSQDPADALHDIKHVSATALRDLRATLGLLREQGDPAPTAPAFDLEALPALVEQARAAGLEADLDVRVNGAVVPSAIGAAAYRIVQEALTNVLRHAHASHASVQVRATHAALDIEVTDDGQAAGSAAPPGLGLRGMSERSVALGGHLDVGPRTNRGWRVHAVLPLSGGDPG
jgi:signal transduction histidine kinase